ncbi:hypothetical protein Celaphus_00019527 [Cervus elaphus hippelaphus]|uniref:NADH dehydrogenase subunit 5 C-terminal domain-containing protein n=1 Tax=Cervus elaphus hippelaphus TaxID=46360 RepID=A0A212C375_CEREH|nr:hypothetical protein Celaphus_00019527 [Cervus elaphus hippelaphus]
MYPISYVMPRVYHNIYSNMCHYPNDIKINHCFLHLQPIRPHDSNNWHQPTLLCIPLSPKKCFCLFQSHSISVIQIVHNLNDGQDIKKNRSIFAGFLISNNIPPTAVPQITIPCYLKRTAPALNILGFILALKTSSNTKAEVQLFKCIQGYFFTIIHCLTPYLNLTSQKSASPF